MIKWQKFQIKIVNEKNIKYYQHGIKVIFKTKFRQVQYE